MIYQTDRAWRRLNKDSGYRYAGTGDKINRMGGK